MARCVATSSLLRSDPIVPHGSGASLRLVVLARTTGPPRSWKWLPESPNMGDIVDNVAMTSRTDPSEKESLSNESRWMTLMGVGTGVGTSPRQGLLPADSYRSQPRGRTFCRFPSTEMH
jgi:hypothetical protein